jgi:hypothetical protein
LIEFDGNMAMSDERQETLDYAAPALSDTKPRRAAASWARSLGGLYCGGDVGAAIIPFTHAHTKDAREMLLSATICASLLLTGGIHLAIAGSIRSKSHCMQAALWVAACTGILGVIFVAFCGSRSQPPSVALPLLIVPILEFFWWNSLRRLARHQRSTHQ